jgi:hypothetical protein
VKDPAVERVLIICFIAEVAELVDAPALGAGRSNPVEVRVLSSAPKLNLGEKSKIISIQTIYSPQPYKLK